MIRERDKEIAREQAEQARRMESFYADAFTDPEGTPHDPFDAIDTCPEPLEFEGVEDAWIWEREALVS